MTLKKRTIKALFQLAAGHRRTKRIPLGLAFAVAVTFPHPDAAATPTVVNLGTARDFAVLAGAGITITGPTTIVGDIGTHPTPTITGFGDVTLTGANHGDDAVTQQAKIDLATAYADAAGRSADTSYVGGFDLVGLTLPSGVYHDASSLFLSGTLTLDAQGNSDAVWIFQAGSTLITGSDSMVALIGGAQACHVFWQVGSSATLGTDTDFVGNILASESITLDTRATVNGRVLAQNGAVTLDSNTITKSVCIPSSAVPDAGGTLLPLGSALMVLLGFRQRLFRAV